MMETEIEFLRAENKKLLAALADIIDTTSEDSPFQLPAIKARANMAIVDYDFRLSRFPGELDGDSKLSCSVKRRSSTVCAHNRTGPKLEIIRVRGEHRQWRHLIKTYNGCLDCGAAVESKDGL